MKNAIITFGLGACILLCFIIHSVITTKDVSNNEAEKTLSNAIEQAINTMTIKPAYTIQEVNALVTELGKNVHIQLSSDSKLAIKLNEADWDKGVYKMTFTQSIPTSNGNIHTVSVEKVIHTESYQRPEDLTSESENSLNE